MKLINDIQVLKELGNKLNDSMDWEYKLGVSYLFDLGDKYLVGYNTIEYLKYGLDRFMLIGPNAFYFLKEEQVFEGLKITEVQDLLKDVDFNIVKNFHEVALNPIEALKDVVNKHNTFYADDVIWFLEKLRKDIDSFDISCQYDIACLDIPSDFKEDVINLFKSLNISFKEEYNLVCFKEGKPWDNNFLVPKPILYTSEKQAEKAKIRREHLEDYLKESRSLGYDYETLDRLETLINEGNG